MNRFKYAPPATFLMNSGTKLSILNYLERSDWTQNSSSAISKALGINRVTLTKYLTVLETEGEIISKQIGMAKLWRKNSGNYVQYFSDTANGKLLKNFLDQFEVGIRIFNKEDKPVWSNTYAKKKGFGKKCMTCLAGSLTCPVKESIRLKKSVKSPVKNKDGYFETIITPIINADQNGAIEEIILISKKEYQATEKLGIRLVN